MVADREVGRRPAQTPGGFRGIDQSQAAEHLAPTQLADALNVVLRNGRIAPRPGYVLARDVSFAFTPAAMKDFGTDGPFQAANDIEVDVTNNKIYVSVGGDLWYMDFDGTNAAKVISSEPVYSFTLDVPGTRIFYWNGTKIRVYNKLIPGGTSADVLTPGGPLNGMAYYNDPSPPQARIYYTTGTGDTVRRCDDDGLNDEEVCDVGGTTFDIDIDTGTEIAYFSNISENKIYSVPLGAAQSPTVVITATIWQITRLALDLTNNYIYWLQALDDSVRRSALDGSNQVIVIPNAGGDPGGIALDPAGTRMYFFHRTTSLVFKALTDTSGVEIISATDIRRQLLGVDGATEFTKDLVLFQMLDTVGQASDYGIWFSDSDQAFLIRPGYKDGAGVTPSFWCMNDRDADAGPGEPFSTKSGRATYAWQGAGINTGKGGMLIADGSGGYVFNYVLGDTIWNLQTYNGGATFTLTFNGETTGNLSYSSGGAQVIAALEALASVDNVIVERVDDSPSAGDRLFIVRFSGIWSGQDTPALTSTGGTPPLITRVQEGGTETDHRMYLRPAGLPLVQPNIDFPPSGSGDLDGYYSYRLVYYSTTLRLESKPSIELKGRTDSGESSAGQLRLNWTNPSTLWFDGDGEGIPTGPLIDRVRIFRKRLGSKAGYPNEDGLPAGQVRGDWFLIADVDASLETFTDTLADTSTEAADTNRIMVNNGYPPANANYVAIHNQTSLWASMTPGDYNLWISEPPVAGTLRVGQLGFEYVPDSGYIEPAMDQATDMPFTGVHSFGGLALIGMTEKVIASDPRSIGDVLESSVRPLEGAAGFASHWCVVRAATLPDTPAALVWMNAKGWPYFYAEGVTRLIGRNLIKTAKSLVRKNWHDTDIFDADFDSWYFCSGVLDPDNNRIIFSVIVNDTGSGYSWLNMVYDLETREWTLWDIPMRCMFLGREWDSAVAVPGTEVVVFAGPGAKLYRLVDGKADGGVAFNWFYQFGTHSYGDSFGEKHSTVSLEFVERSFGGAAAAVTIDVDADGNNLQFAGKAIGSADGMVHVGPVHRAKRLQIKVSGTQVDDQTHPELVASEPMLEPTGRKGR
jgi:hypothetical protein